MHIVLCAGRKTTEKSSWRKSSNQNNFCHSMLVCLCQTVIQCFCFNFKILKPCLNKYYRMSLLLVRANASSVHLNKDESGAHFPLLYVRLQISDRWRDRNARFLQACAGCPTLVEIQRLSEATRRTNMRHYNYTC